MKKNKFLIYLLFFIQLSCSDPFDLTRTDIISENAVFDDPVLADAFLFDLYDRAQFHIKSGNGNLNMGLISSYGGESRNYGVSWQTPYTQVVDVDFNENGVREPYSWPDVLGSIANYLRMNGYKKNSNDYRKGGDIYKSVYAYNHADNYVMAVLELTERIRERCTGSRKYYPTTVTDFDRKRVRMYKSKGWAPDKTINMDAWVE